MSDDSATGDDDSETDDDPAAWWNDVYDSDGPAPWDVGEPQPAFVELAESDGLTGRVLDVGCGTGTHACWAAERGHPTVGVDVSEKGIELARKKADERISTGEERRELDATFRVANALDLPGDLGPFDTVLDSGLFHAFQPHQRGTYADELADVVATGGRVFVLGFREGAPEDWGPNPFTPDDVRAAFADGWKVRETRNVEFVTREAPVPGLLATVERT